MQESSFPRQIAQSCQTHCLSNEDYSILGKGQLHPPYQSHPNKKKHLTYTLKFVCLASKSAIKPPTTVKERTDLSNACLGDKSITFVENEPVYDKIVEQYPQLSEVGGFDFLLYQRGGGRDAGFHALNPPHVASRLKDLCGQAKIYIRPVQKDILLTTNTNSETIHALADNEPGVQDSSQVCFRFINPLNCNAPLVYSISLVIHLMPNNFTH